MSVLRLRCWCLFFAVAFLHLFPFAILSTGWVFFRVGSFWMDGYALLPWIFIPLLSFRAFVHVLYGHFNN
jgi:hypothetical protein